MQIRSSDITSILDVCLERMRRGENIEACVHDYPAEAEELEPLLIAAMYARSQFSPPSLSPEARRAIQRKLHLAVAARQPAPQRAPARRFAPLVMRFALALVVALLGLGGGVAAAQTSLPGSSLYPLKRASEGVRLRLASSPIQRATLHLDFAATRSAEILALVSGEPKIVDDSLVDDLDQEYQLAWEEIGRVPADEVPDLVGRYIVERRADVRVFSAALTHANAGARAQIQRAVQRGEQALAVVDPASGPAPQPPLDRDGNSGAENSDNSGAPNSGDKPATAGPKATPEGKPADAGPKATPKATPARPKATPKATPEGKPANAGPKATPEGKPADSGPKDTPKATPEGKPADAGPPATPEGKPADAGPPATPENQPDNKPDDKPGNADPKPKPKPDHGKP